ncbi:MAG: MFS transporter [Rhizobiales bacterium]|nr:MFS transporter [Hyphomicrobiales bacterium]
MPCGFTQAALRVVNRIVDVRPAEVSALAWSWLYIFSVLSAYYVLRPIRDQMGVAGGVDNLPWLFTGTLAGMLLLNVPYGFLIRSFPRTIFIPIAYRFFSANILIFALALHVASPDQAIWVGRVFFIWTSIFNLFVVSIFWALIVDLFSSEQGKRLFGFIAAGATLGSIAGSAVTATTARHLAAGYLLVGAALLLEVAVFCVRRLSRLSGALSKHPRGDDGDRAIGGSGLAGFRDALASPYLLNVSLFLLFFAVTSTFLYFQQATIVSRTFHDRASQTAFFATIDLAVNLLTFVAQIVLTGPLLRRLGVGATLAILPAFSIVSFAAVAAWPAVASVVVAQVLRRSGNFAIARPTREILFTVVSREDRYKTKSFIDTVVYRLGDQVGAWSFASLGYFGLGLTAVSAVASLASVLWLLNSLWLGKKEEELGRATAERLSPPAAGGTAER